MAMAALQLSLPSHFAPSCSPSSSSSSPSSSPSPSPSPSHMMMKKKRSSPMLRRVVMEFYLKPLPFDADALEPHMSKKTLEIHWGKHHRTYVDNLNKQIKGTHLEGKTLDEVVKFGYNNGNPTAYFNNAGQAWNHEFFWQSIKPNGGKKPEGELLNLIERDFGSFEALTEEFRQVASTQFGSGWAWLSAKATDPLNDTKFAKLVVEKTSNAFSPLISGHIPLLTIDVWEHAYYLDYQNRRLDYISTFFNELISWEMVAARLERSKVFLNFYDPVIPPS